MDVQFKPDGTVTITFKEVGSRELRERRERAHQQIFYAPVRVVRVIRGYLFLPVIAPAADGSGYS